MFEKIFKKSGKSPKGLKVPSRTISLADIGKFKGINIIVQEKGKEPKKVFVNKIFAPNLVDDKKRGKSNRLSESSLGTMALLGRLKGVRFIPLDDYLRGTAKASLNELMKEHNLLTNKVYRVVGYNGN